MQVSVQIAASLALEQKRVLILVSDAALVSKLLVIAMASQHPGHRAHAHEVCVFLLLGFNPTNPQYRRIL